MSPENSDSTTGATVANSAPHKRFPAPARAPNRHGSVRAPTNARSPALARLLELADAYLAEKAMRQAMEMYFDLIEKHDDSPEIEPARDRLLKIAEHYESAGERRQARGIYERLV